MNATSAPFSEGGDFPSSSNQGSSPICGLSNGPTVSQPAPPHPRISFKGLHGPWRTPPLVCAWCLTLLGWMQDFCPAVMGQVSHGICPTCSAREAKEAGL